MPHKTSTPTRPLRKWRDAALRQNEQDHGYIQGLKMHADQDARGKFGLYGALLALPKLTK